MKLIRRFPIISYVLMALLLSYGVGIGVYILLHTLQAKLGTHLANVDDSVMRSGPTLAGLLICWLTAGAAGAKDLIARVFRWRAPVALYLTALGVPPVLTLTGLLLRGDAVELESLALWSALGTFLGQLAITSIFGGLSEEIGWRGFMLPRLAERYGALTASALVALGWLAWHVPAYLLADKGTADPFLPFAAIMLPFCVVFTWLYYRSHQSLLLPILLHGSINASYYSLEKLLPQVTTAAGFQPAFDWAVTGLWWGAAAVVLVVFRRQLGKLPPRAGLAPV